MLDSQGFRLNVGMVIANGYGDVLWARRIRQDGWQFPQGGIIEGETVQEAMYRELKEEVGLSPDHVEVLSVTKRWLYYRLPERNIKAPSDKKQCIGQKQKWFLLQLKADEQIVDISANNTPEFDSWEWVNYWYPVNQIVDFKRWVYQRMLRELSRPHSIRVGENLAKDHH